MYFPLPKLVSLTIVSAETIINVMKKIGLLESHIGFWLRYVSNNVSLTFKKKLEKHEIGVGEWVVLGRLYDHKTVSPGILAEQTGMTRGAISKLLDRLLKKALILRVESTQDRRFQEIALTRRGKKLVPKLAALADSNDHHFFGHLKPHQKDELLKVLKEIVSHHAWDQIPIN